MAEYQHPNTENWLGRVSNEQLYLHEKVACSSIEQVLKIPKKSFCILGYACDEGVQRNQGRVGAKKGPDHIRKALGKFPNHLKDDTLLYDLGNVVCNDNDMESAQILLSDKVSKILELGSFPILLGGGHDIAYGHFKGIQNTFGKNKKVGIINFDAHFDLRNNENGNNSGTPFYQLAKENPQNFHYLCLGIRQDANNRQLFETASETETIYIENNRFQINNLDGVNHQINTFLNRIDHVYATIDLDGFSSAYAPGVSAPSPMGFTPDIVLKSLETIILSKKLVSLDLAEFNPTYDIDGQTAKLAASLIHKIIHSHI